MPGPIRIAVLANASQAKRELQGLAGVSGKMGAAVAKGAALGAVAIGAFAVKAVKDASDLGETLNKSNTIFGKNAAEINKWSRSSAKNLGLSRQAALDSAAGFGDMFKQLGLGGQKATDLSKATVKMAADFGSFNNLPTADVADRISAAYRGEFDSIQALVPNINAARVEQEALAKTHKKSAKDLTAADKALAVNAILTKDGARAMGDFAKTSGGAANRQKILAAQFENISAKVGGVLLPVFALVLTGIEKLVGFIQTSVVPAFASFAPSADSVKSALSKIASVAGAPWAKTLAVAIGAIATAMLIAAAATKVWAGVMLIFNTVMAANPVGLIVLAIIGLVAAVVFAWKNFETFRNVVTMVWTGVKAAVTAVVGVLTSTFKKYRAAVVAVWSGIKAGAKAAWGFIKTVVRLVVLGITVYIRTFRTAATTVWTAVKTAASTAWSRIQLIIFQKIVAARDKVRSVVDRIKALFSPTTLLSAGRQLIQGLIDGIAEKMDVVVQKVKAGLELVDRMVPGSPIRSGPLMGWNNGAAGKALMDLLIFGVQSRVPAFNNALDGVTASPSLALADGTSGAPAGGVVINVNVPPTADAAAVGREVVRSIRAYESQSGHGWRR